MKADFSKYQKSAKRKSLRKRAQRIEEQGRPLPATSTATIMSDLPHNIVPENASSSDERPVNRDL